MNSCSGIGKILDLVGALDALEKQINEVNGQIGQFQGEGLAEILTGRKSGMFRIPVRMKRVVLTWLTAYHGRGLTARELLNDRDSLEKYSGTKFPRRVEAYSMLLGRLDKRYVTRVKQGREFRYYITMAGSRHLLGLIRLEEIAERNMEMAEEFRKMEKESREKAFLASLRTKITNLQMEQLQVLIEKIPGIMDTTEALEIYSTWGRTLLEAAESIRALQISASRPTDQATRESAVNKGEEACNKLHFMITLMLALVCWLSSSGEYAKNPDGGS